MSQEKIAKILMLIVLLYVAVPVLSLDGNLIQKIFTVAWIGFACMLLMNLLLKKETVRKRTVKKQNVHSDQKVKKSVPMER